MSLLATSFSESLKSSQRYSKILKDTQRYSKILKDTQSSKSPPRYKKTAMKNFVKKIITTKSQVSTLLLALAIYVLFLSFIIIHELKETIEKEQYLRMCSEPYICVVPPLEWKAKSLLGFTIYKRIEV